MNSTWLSSTKPQNSSGLQLSHLIAAVLLQTSKKVVFMYYGLMFHALILNLGASAEAILMDSLIDCACIYVTFVHYNTPCRMFV